MEGMYARPCVCFGVLHVCTQAAAGAAPASTTPAAPAPAPAAAPATQPTKQPTTAPAIEVEDDSDEWEPMVGEEPGTGQGNPGQCTQHECVRA